MKYFALLAFIPLILFRYRKISRLIKVFMAGMLLVIVSMVIMLQSSTASAMMQDENYYVNKQIEFFATIRLDLGDTRFLGLMGLFYGILCVIAYTIPNNDKEKNKKYALWLALGGYMCFFLFYPCNFYWYVLLAPFLILVAYNHRENLKINLILIMLHELMTAICFIYLSPWVLFGPQSFSYLFLKDYAIEENAFQYFVNTALHADLGPYMAIFRGIAYACAGCFMWINFPRRLAKEQGVEGSEEQKELEGEIQAITWMRILVLYVWIFICVYSLISFNRG